MKEVHGVDVEAYLNDVFNHNWDLTPDELSEKVMSKIEKENPRLCPYKLYDIEDKLIDLLWGID